MPRDPVSPVQRHRCRQSQPVRLSACLAAALAHAFGATALATPVLRHLPQTGIQIERTPQTGVSLPWQTPPASTSPVKAARPVSAHAPADHSRIRIGHVPQQSSGPPTLQLRLSTTLSWPTTQVVPALDQLTGQEPPATSIQSAPGAVASLPRHAWGQALLDLLQADEQGTPQAQLPQIIEEHAAALRDDADGQLAERLGWALYRAARYAQAASWFSLALQRDPTLQSARMGKVYALQRAGELESAYEAARDVDDLRALRADLAVQLALRARNQHDFDSAVHWLESAVADGNQGEDVQTLLAWSELQAGLTAQAARRFELLYAAHPDNADLAQGLYLSLHRSGQAGRIDRLAAQPGPFADLARRARALQWRDLGLARDAAELDPGADVALTGAAGPSVALGFHARSKSGEPGTSQLHSLQNPRLNLRWTNSLGAWDVDAAFTRLDAGAPPPPALVGSALGGSHGSSQSQNVGLDATLHWRELGPQGLFASLGLTPARGAVPPTWTGGLGWRSVNSKGALSVELQRLPVADSTLSLTGLRDPASGQSWGRVLRQGLRVQGYRAVADHWNASGQLLAQRVDGQHVASNTHRGLSVGLARDLELPGMRFFSLGPNLGYEQYARNLSGFTWGHGGYFSPQHFLSQSVMATFQTADARRLVLAGQVQIGWQSVRQDASPCFPLSPPAANPSCNPIAASRSHGIGTSIALQWIGLLAPHWALENSLVLRTGPAYQERAVYLGLRYFLEPRTTLFGADLPKGP